MATYTPLEYRFWDEERRRLWDEIAPIMLNVYLAGGMSAEKLLSPGVRVLIKWDVFNQLAIDFLNSWRGGMLAEMEEYTRRRVVGHIQEWIRSGEHIRVLEAKLDPLFGRQRAKRVAVTEVTRAYAEGNMAAWKSTGYVTEKRWMTANDERVCPICGPLHDTVVSIDGGWTMDAEGNVIEDIGTGQPGLLSPPAHPNCRCWLQPVVSVEAADIAQKKRLGLI